MAVIKKTITLVGSKGRVEENVLFDSGATYSCIQLALAQVLAQLEPLPEIMKFDTAGKGYELKAEYAVRLDFYLNGDRFSDEFMVVEGLADKVLIGAKTLQAWRMKLDFEHDQVLYDPRVTKLRRV